MIYYSMLFYSELTSRQVFFWVRNRWILLKYINNLVYFQVDYFW